ncbi:N-acetylglucosamine 6-phosphate deacetylase [Ignavigranum ruoffiae]|uniref:N-acetylglucosamine 6-phosphate deacetylase n=1 Tax=Ignavigranum ruoffiae TaxID=89093 RepID=A0A1H9B726_9LACT|nr:N-acetylglucosamine-6-phosphate deacetylase [Ignavigranum ruoffiae]SEP84635.1 N-acetylglucosamine 6-phosphate deacetylase [Ignavigranum ruoffiae]
MKVIYSDNILHNEGMISGYIIIEKGKIINILNEFNGSYVNYKDEYILPGFIDQHVHGWGRGSLFFNKSPESLIMMVRDLPKEGVTSFLPTTTTGSVDDIYQTIDIINKVIEKNEVGAEILGIHLEGPFINPEKSGAQSKEFCIKPNLKLFKKFENKCVEPNQIRLITIAPELENAQELIEYCREKNIQVSAGHTDATFEQIIESKKWGVNGVTHMYGAMSGLHHRNLGTVGAALYDADLYCEFAKQTGITVNHEAFDIAYRIKTADKIIHSTDCLGHARQNKAYFHAKRGIWFIPQDNLIIEQNVNTGLEKKYNIDNYDDVRKLEMSYIDSVRNMVKYTKMTWEEIGKVTSLNPARYLNLENKGKIDIGKDADFTILTKDINLKATYINGQLIYTNTI